MAINDYVYRLKAMAGDTTPHDELGVSGDIIGGTIALVDRGGGDWAWRFSGGQASVAIPAHTVDYGVSGSGITIGITLKVTNYGTMDHRNFIGIGPDLLAASATGPLTSGLHLGRTSANNIRAVGKVGYTNITAVGTTERTYIVRVKPNASGTNDFVNMWLNTPDRVGTDANVFANGGTITGATIYDLLEINTNNGIVVEVKDYIVWASEKTDAEAAAMADGGLRAVVDATIDTTAPVMTGTMTMGTITHNSAVVDWSATTFSDNLELAGFDTSLDGTTWTQRGLETSYTHTGLTASTGYTAYTRARDASDNTSTPALSIGFSTIAYVADTTPPALTGTITFTNITHNSATISWPVATDNVAVEGYDLSLNGGTSYADVGNVNSYPATGLTASTLQQIRVRARDTSDNLSTPVLSGSFTTSVAPDAAFLTKPMTNKYKQKIANVAGWKVYIRNATTGAAISTKTGLTTDAEGRLAFSEALCAIGTTYELIYVSPAGRKAISDEVAQ